MTSPLHNTSFYRTGHWSERIPAWVLPDGVSLIKVFSNTFLQLRGKRPVKVSFDQEVSFFLDRLKDTEMPRKKKETGDAKSTTKTKFSSSVSWVNIQLTDDDVERLTATGATDDELAVDFLALCGYGFTVGCKPAPNGDGWMAYLTGNVNDDEGTIVGLSGYANSPIDACSSLLFKFHDKLDGVLIKPEPKSSRRFG